MTRRRTPLQQYKEAQQMAHDGGCFICQKAGRFLGYRKTTTRNVFVGRTTHVSSLRRLVGRITGLS